MVAWIDSSVASRTSSMCGYRFDSTTISAAIRRQPGQLRPTFILFAVPMSNRASVSFS